MLISGCAPLMIGAAAGGGAAVWYKGRLEDAIPAPLPKVQRAVVSALKDLDITITEEKGDNLKGQVKGKLSDGSQVWVDLELLGESTTSVTIRVGVMGNEVMSRQILQKTRKNLGLD